jgi:hypothetical protein
MTTGPAALTLRMLTAAALVVDAVVHYRLAGTYSFAGSGGSLNEGTLFRAEAVIALIAAALVLVLGTRVAYVVAFVVSVSAFGAVMLYRYVDVPAIGPIPSMYEPIWYTQKTLSAIAEALGSLLAAAGLVHQRRSTRQADATRAEHDDTWSESAA